MTLHAVSHIDACPVWCDDDHVGQEHPDDRMHLADFSPIPAVIRDPRDPNDGEHPALAVDLALVTFQTFDDPEIWVTLASEQHHHLTLSLESAARLHRRLTQLLATVTSSQHQ